MWHEGTIGVPKGNGKYTVVHYWVKAYEEGSQYGIEGGRISKLTPITMRQKRTGLFAL